MIPGNIKDLQKQADVDFLLAMQHNPAIVSQILVWQMVKQTAEWPPESMAQAVQISRQMKQCLGNITPFVEVMDFVQDDSEEENEEGSL